MKKDVRKRYIAYVRKSEEREERQQLSVSAQIREISDRFKDIEIIDVIEETKSAFKPNNRPLFDGILERIEKGEAEGIVSYHPNRLSRNEIDAANITYRLRSKNSMLSDLKFVSYSFENTPEGIMMLQMALNQGQYESAKQGILVSRGMKEKVLTKKERPGQVPHGYMKVPLLDSNGKPIINSKDQKVLTKTDKDPERYEIVKTMWEMFLSGLYTTGEIRIWANNAGFRTRQFHRRDGSLGGNNKLGSSSIHRIFTNPFYAGLLTYGNELLPGHHSKMITLEQFDYAQKLLGDKGKPRSGLYEYSYIGLIKCGECGCSIVGKTRDKKLANGQLKSYVYYHCTRKSEARPCNQKVYTSLERLEKEIDLELQQYMILPEFKDLALRIINRKHKSEVKERNSSRKSQENSRKAIQSQIDKLVDMRTSDLLDDEYVSQRNRLRHELAKIDEKLQATSERAEDWLKVVDKAFDFAVNAQYHFANGDTKTKREILSTLGKQMVLKDQRLYIEPNEWLVPIKEKYPELEAKYLKVRTKQKAVSSDENTALDAILESWRARRGSNPRHPA